MQDTGKEPIRQGEVLVSTGPKTHYNTKVLHIGVQTESEHKSAAQSCGKQYRDASTTVMLEEDVFILDE